MCDRYGIDNSRRTLHGALLDAEILAEVYVAMTRGQESLIIDLAADEDGEQAGTDLAPSDRPRRAQSVVRASEDLHGK